MNPSHHTYNHGPTTWKSETELVQSIRTVLAAISFWSAIILPFVYVPLLATGLETLTLTIAFCVLLALNVVTLVFGHSYHPG